MNYIKNPTLRPAVFPKVKDASENYSIGVQYNDHIEVDAVADSIKLICLYPGLTTYGYVASLTPEGNFTVDRDASVDLPFFLNNESPEQLAAIEAHPVKVRCWRVISQQLQIRCMNTNATGYWEAIRVQTHRFKGLRWTHPDEGFSEPTKGFPDWIDEILNAELDIVDWQNHPSFVCGKLSDLNRCYFQANLQHQHWPWICNCCSGVCETPQGGADVPMEGNPDDDNDPNNGTGEPGTGEPGNGEPTDDDDPMTDPTFPPVIPPVFPTTRPPNNNYTGTKPVKDEDTEVDYLDDADITVYDDPLIPSGPGIGEPETTVWDPSDTIPIQVSPAGVTPQVVEPIPFKPDGFIKADEIPDNNGLPLERPITVPTTDPRTQGDELKYIIDEINEARAKEGSPPLQWADGNAEAAQYWADVNAKDEHIDDWFNPDHDFPSLGMLGERVTEAELVGVTGEATGVSTLPSAVAGMLNEGKGTDPTRPNHWDILMDPAARFIGIGMTIRPDGQVVTILLPSAVSNNAVNGLGTWPIGTPNVAATGDLMMQSFGLNNIGAQVPFNDLVFPEDWYTWRPDQRLRLQVYLQDRYGLPKESFPLMEDAPLLGQTVPKKLPNGVDAYFQAKVEPEGIFVPEDSWIYSNTSPASKWEQTQPRETRNQRMDLYERTCRILDATYGRLVNPPTTTFWPNTSAVPTVNGLYQNWPKMVYDFARTFDVTTLKDPLGRYFKSKRDFLIYEYWVYHRQRNISIAEQNKPAIQRHPEEIAFGPNTQYRGTGVEYSSKWQFVEDYAVKETPFPFPLNDGPYDTVLIALGAPTPALAPPKWNNDFASFTYDGVNYPKPDSTSLLPEDAWFTFSGFVPSEMIWQYAKANAEKWNKSPMTYAVILLRRYGELVDPMTWPSNFYIDVTDAVPINIDTEIGVYVNSIPVDTRFFSVKGHKMYLAFLWYNYLVSIPFTPNIQYDGMEFPVFKTNGLTTEQWPAIKNYTEAMIWAKTKNTTAWTNAFKPIENDFMNAYSMFISNMFYTKSSSFETYEELEATSVLGDYFANYTGYTSRSQKMLHEKHALGSKLQRRSFDNCPGPPPGWLEERQAAYDAALAARQAEIAAAIAAYDAAVAYRNSEIARIDAARQALVDARNAEIAASIAAYNDTVADRNTRLANRKRWPPVALTGHSTIVTGQTYGNGTYEAWDSGYIAPDEPYKAFNRLQGDNLGWTSRLNYNTTTGFYTGPPLIPLLSAHPSGEWLQLYSSDNWTLRSYYITNHHQESYKNRAPRTWRVVGWNGTAFVTIDERTEQINWNAAERRSYVVQNPITTLGSYIIIVSRTNGSDGCCSIMEWGLFQTDEIEPWVDIPVPVYPDTTPLSLPPVPICGEEPPPPGQTPYTPLYTKVPEIGQACIEAQTDLSPLHTPEALNLSNWPTWDGTTTIDQMSTPAQLAAWIWPNGRLQMRGLKDLFNSVHPFYNTTSPTVAEIEDWHVEVIMLLRRLVGKGHFTMNKSSNLYLATQWSSERKWSTVWDGAYPTGTCGPGSAPHCGYFWFPNATDQEPYFMVPGQTTVVGEGGSEGIFTIEKNLNWAVKFSAMMCDVISLEGNNGHGGPMFRRGSMGVSFMCDGSANTTVRCQWGAPLYTEP